MITFVCPDCQATFKVPDNQVGVRGVCKRCGGSIQVPRSSVSDRPAKSSAVLPRAAQSNADRGSVKRQAIPPRVLALVILAGGLLACFMGIVILWVVKRGEDATGPGVYDLIGQNSPTRESNRSTNEHDKSTRPTNEHDLGEEMRFGDLGVTVMRGRVEEFLSVTSIDRPVLHDPALVITLAIKNYSPNRIIEVGSQTDVALAEDDVGNKYHPLNTRSEFGLPTRILGQIPPGKVSRVRSDEPAGDVLVFERPVAGASLVWLNLDASRYGGTGTIRVYVPFKQVFNVQIQANREWQDTGVDTIDGSEVTVTYKGSWSKDNATCSVAGFAAARDKQASTFVSLQEEKQKLGQEIWRLVQAVEAEKNMFRRPAPKQQRRESDEAYNQRVEAYKKESETVQLRSNEAAKRQEELRVMSKDIDKRIQQIDREMKSQRVLGNAPQMCLVAKLGERGLPFVPGAKIAISATIFGRLYLQPNDKDLQNNSGSLGVEIVLRR
jgi:predicted Zn finger-like uncharacterized protein